MFISINWIKDFVDLEGIDVDKLIYNFTMSTAEVEGSKKYGYDTIGVRVGKIVSIEDIKESQKLHKVEVDIGDEKVVSICGTKNIFIGAKIPFAKVGSTVQGIRVDSGKLAGYESFGICLSEKELGFSNNHDGVMILDDSLEVGEDIKKYIPLEDTVFEVDNKSLTNRPDLWGHYGIAREIACLTKRELKPLDIEDLSAFNALEKLKINVESSDDCLRYSAIKIENITKKVSPYTMRLRLHYAGSRSINLLADLTNYIMLELGQPLHAFDGDKISNINVKRLKEDTSFATLDDVLRNIPKDSLMINNEDTPVAIAGIMGGKNSQITDNTSKLFLEAATFDSTLVRKTAIKLGLRTDASARYEKTLDPELTYIACARFVKLLSDIDSNVKITSSFTDLYLKKYEKIRIDIQKNYFDKYIGKELDLYDIVDTLKRLKFKVDVDKDLLKVEVPSFRATKDISLKADLVEEVARIYGYDNILPTPSKFEAVPQRLDTIHSLEYDIKQILATKFGASEIHSYVWYNKEKNKELGIEVGDNLKIVNSLSKGDDVLRSCMGPTILYALDNNIKYYNNVKLFEIGRVFEYKFDGSNANESKMLGLSIASLKDDEKTVMFEAKQMIDTIVRVEKNLEVKYELNKDIVKDSFIHPKNSYIIKVNDIIVGYVALVHPKINDNINKKASICIAQLNIDILDGIKSKDIKFVEATKYQNVNIDISVIVDQKVMFLDIENVIKSMNLKYLSSYELVDIYENTEKLFGKKSVTLRFVLASNDKTLSREEIDTDMNTVIDTFDKYNMIINK